MLIWGHALQAALRMLGPVVEGNAVSASATGVTVRSEYFYKTIDDKVSQILINVLRPQGE
jgi:hypothetical protein